MGALTIGVRLQVDVERVFDVGPGSFQPQPKVHSTVVRLVPHDRWGLDDDRRTRVRSVARELFGQRRKQLQKSLRSLPRWNFDPAGIDRIEARTGLDLSRRPESLDMEEWLTLEAALTGAARSRGGAKSSLEP
jgi:16S rRNA (adenine1518-N6/adenine1519-N6)-dimethyltransferase